MTTRALISMYYNAWVSDGLTAAHADADAVLAWLTDDDLWSDFDRDILGWMDADEIGTLADGIAYMAKEKLIEEETR